MAFAQLSFDIDLKKMERAFSHIEKKVIPQAAAGWLNGVAFAARQQLIEHNKEAFDGHTGFTDRAWLVDKARPDKGQAMYAVVKARPLQAGYLKFQIFGGDRKVGDSGAGPFDLLVGADKVNKAGNIRKGYAKSLGAKNRAEKAARRDLRAKRVVAREAGQPVRPLMWVTQKPRQGGLFWGEIGGREGYWQRPLRTKASPGKKVRGAVTVVNRSKPKALLSVADKARYEPRFRYNQQLQKAIGKAGTQAAFAAELKRAMAKGR